MPYGSRCCSSCGRNLSKGSYSNNQWRKGVGQSRCYACVEGGGGGGYGYNDQQQQHNQVVENRSERTARRNNSNHATFENYELTHPFAEGGFRWVAKGKYTEGARSGEECVCKWFKSGHVDQARFFDLDIKAMEKAHDLVKEWNNRHMIDKMVMVNIPEVWTFTAGHLSGKKNLV